MTILEQIKNGETNFDFNNVIADIDKHYDFFPTKFTNGAQINVANQNNGSCKIFYFAKINNLSKEQTLDLFGDYYKKEVLQDPEGDDHQNIRNFMKYGWDDVKFDGEALVEK
ncbi:HopJ type III effector protein [Soonwooa sp.]|uniref:HopJ type III effector protein n=1 Tax=Soonwooa sp. TaxID=1938592 RepID=UPI0028A78CCF|nr:HopJ type III effector protein [Soonwooa sp.]